MCTYRVQTYKCMISQCHTFHGVKATLNCHFFWPKIFSGFATAHFKVLKENFPSLFESVSCVLFNQANTEKFLFYSWLILRHLHLRGHNLVTMDVQHNLNWVYDSVDEKIGRQPSQYVALENLQTVVSGKTGASWHTFNRQHVALHGWSSFQPLAVLLHWPNARPRLSYTLIFISDYSPRSNNSEF